MNQYEQIYAVVRQIPAGKVATYGQVAELAGLPGHARQVGYALHALHSDEIPWHRVINAAGRISLSPLKGGAEIQRRLLLAEGVEVSAKGQIALTRYRWEIMDEVFEAKE